MNKNWLLQDKEDPIGLDFNMLKCLIRTLPNSIFEDGTAVESSDLVLSPGFTSDQPCDLGQATHALRAQVTPTQQR